MPKIKQIKRLKNTTESSAKALVLIDLGNGEPKARVIMPTGEELKLQFPSIVQEVTAVNADCIRLASSEGFKYFRIGHEGANAEAYRTGSSAGGKIHNARPLLLEFLKRAVEFSHGERFYCDVLFTCPNNVAYVEKVSKQLKGVHSVFIPIDPGDLEASEVEFSVFVCDAFGELESVRAVHLLKNKPVADVQLIDIGSRTCIFSRVTKNGSIRAAEHRIVLDDKGVHALAILAVQRETFAALEGMEAPTPQAVINLMFSPVHKEQIAELLKPLIQEQIAPVISRFVKDDAPVYLVGGGAILPGMAEVLNAKPINKNPQWAALDGLAVVADRYLAHKQKAAVDG